MSFRESVRERLAEIRADARAPTVLATGKWGEILERVGTLTGELEIKLGLLPVEDIMRVSPQGTFQRIALSPSQAEMLGGQTAHFIVAARSLGFLGIVGAETREASLENGLKALAAEIAAAMSRVPRSGGGDGGDDAVAWLSVADAAPKPTPN